MAKQIWYVTVSINQQFVETDRREFYLRRIFWSTFILCFPARVLTSWTDGIFKGVWFPFFIGFLSDLTVKRIVMDKVLIFWSFSGVRQIGWFFFCWGWWGDKRLLMGRSPGIKFRCPWKILRIYIGQYFSRFFFDRWLLHQTLGSDWNLYQFRSTEHLCGGHPPRPNHHHHHHRSLFVCTDLLSVTVISWPLSQTFPSRS